MTDQLISFETAKLAKEKGFDRNDIDAGTGPTFSYTIKENGYKEGILNHVYMGIVAPTQFLLQRYLRETYNIHIIIKPFYDSKFGIITYACDIMQIGNYIAKSKRLVIQPTYEGALEQGLIEALKLIP